MEAVDRPKLASSYISHPLKTRRQACFRFALHRRLKRALGNEGAVGAAAAGSDDERGANGSRVARTCNRQLSRLTPLHLPRAPASSRPCFFRVCAKATETAVTDVAGIRLRARMPFAGFRAQTLVRGNAALAFGSFSS